MHHHQFTAPDLSTIASSLDSLEEEYDEGRAGRASTNMDDTGIAFLVYMSSPNNPLAGFFSVQVLDKALDVWGLRFVIRPL